MPLCWKSLRSTALTLALAVAAGVSSAADYTDPTWPCVQRKVPSLSVGLMWTHPLPESQDTDPALRQEVKALAAKLALRRLEVEALRPDIEAFATRHDGSPESLGRVFQRVFKTLSARRTKVISGIETFSLSQITLSKKIETARDEKGALMEAASPDFDRVDALEKQIDWDQTIYSDRQSTITYLCETPTLIERRLFAIAQTLQQQIKNPH